MYGGTRMNIMITLTVWVLFVFFISELIYRVTQDYSEHPIIPEPNNLLGEEE